MKPHLSRTQVDNLRRYQHEGIEPDDVYGRPIGSVMEMHDYEWLEAGVMAGYAPHLDALELAVRANHLWIGVEVEDSRARGADGDAVGWLEATAQDYRRLIAVIEELIENFEGKLERSWKRDPIPDDHEIKALWAEQAAASRRRGRAAGGRRESVLKDVRDLDRLNSKWPRST